MSVCCKQERSLTDALIDRVNSDIVVATELGKPDVLESEIFPPNFHVFRRTSSTGGEVFTTVSDKLSLERLDDVK